MEEMPTSEKLQENIVQMAQGSATKEMIEHIMKCEICKRILESARGLVDWHIEEMEHLT